jgi:glutamyl-tRNA synthetase
VIRLKAPAGETVIEDEVQGRAFWQNKELDDLAAAPDGNPTYMLAVVVDDHDIK